MLTGHSDSGDYYFFPKLEYLTLNYNGLQHPDILDFLHSFNPDNIYGLNLNECDLTNINDLTDLPNRMPNLWDLRLDSRIGIHNDTARQLIAAADNVEVLMLSFKRSELPQLMSILSNPDIKFEKLETLKIWLQVDTRETAIGNADMGPFIAYASHAPWPVILCIHTDVEFWICRFVGGQMQVSHGMMGAQGTPQRRSLPDL
ncbi:hypothetical protein FRB90_006742 [Tulasnella sp. 427]|nr:hypothetical protein FRB90_006742 [Tulasnella sp. 427]